MQPMTLKDILTATGGRLLGTVSDPTIEIHAVATDSRNLPEKSLFIPLIGERFDAHDFLPKAMESEAAGCLTMRPLEHYRSGKFYVLVEDSQKALGDIAQYYKRQFDIPFIAITGSVGKTTTKDMVAQVLSERYKVLKTDGNFNNEIGLPLTLLRLDASYEMCVLEMGMSSFGEIEYLSRLVEPDVAIITNIGEAHMENLGSYENILKAKCEIFSHMKEKGIAVLNGDDKWLSTLQGKLKHQAHFYGTDHKRKPYARDIIALGEKGVRCTIETEKEGFSVSIPAPGTHMVYAALAASVVAKHYGLSADEIAEGVRNFVPTKMRMNVLQVGDFTVFDDAYNANPQSMRAALEVLAQSHGTYKVAILGDMLELGALGATLHHGIGDYAGKVGIDALVAIGDLSREIYQAAKQSPIPDVFYFETKERARNIIRELAQPGASILVKASRGMAFEEIVAWLKA